MKTSLTLIAFLLGLCSVQSQNWQAVGTVALPEPVASFSIDQEQKIYLGTEKGNLIRLNRNGGQEQYFSMINASPVTLTEAWNRLKLFLFFRENQRISILDRFATNPRETSLTDLGIAFAQLAAPGTDHSLWVLDSRLNELRKYQDNRLIFSTPISNPAINLKNAVHLRAYQNRVILLDAKSGFYFFDQFGNYLYPWKVSGANYFQILNGQVITYNGQEIVSFDLFHPEREQRIKAPSTGTAFLGVLKTETGYVFIERHQLRIYRLL